MRPMGLKPILCIVACVIAFSHGYAVRAEDQETRVIYQWQDEQGVVHISDNLEKVPNKFRSSAKKISPATPYGTDQPAVEKGNGASRSQEAPPSSSRDDYQNQLWQARMREARQTVKYLTGEIRSQEEHLKQIKEKWGSGLYGYPDEVAAQIKALENRIGDLNISLEQAQKTVDTDIPDAARKAGIPPGWLRE